ncbi:MAG: alpha/beta hydrolase [Acidobacteriota bacterium]
MKQGLPTSLLQCLRVSFLISVMVTSLLYVSALGQAALTAARKGASPRQTVTLPPGVTSRDARFYSEGVECHGRIFLPAGFSVEAKLPAVVLAPGWGETSISVESFAARFAARGLVAMVIDYRGWGRSGGYLQTVDQVKTDDRLRFSQMTAKVRITRGRLLPQQQILDIRNALYYLQGEPGVDRARVGIWGTDMAGGHVIVTAANDARIVAAVAQLPVIEGRDTPRRASAPTGSLLIGEQKRARLGQTGAPSRAGMVDVESQLAVAEYHPFWAVDQIPARTAVLFILAEKDVKAKNETALAASKLLKGPTDVVTIPGVTPAQFAHEPAIDAAAVAAADWFLKHL